MNDRQGRSLATGPFNFFDDFNDAVRSRVEKDRSAIDDGVAVIAQTVVLRNVIVRHAIT